MTVNPFHRPDVDQTPRPSTGEPARSESGAMTALRMERNAQQAKAERLENELADVRAQLDGMRRTAQRLIDDYGTDWCSDGRETVAEALEPFGIRLSEKPMRLVVTIAPAIVPRDWRTNSGGATSIDFDRELREHLKAFVLSDGTYPFQNCDITDVELDDEDD